MTWTGYLDVRLKANLEQAKKLNEKDWDTVFIVDGAEGSGKSVLAQHIAKFLDDTLTIERIVFTPEDFQKAIIDAKPHTAIIFDEAFTGMAGKSTMSATNKMLMQLLAEIRQKNLYVVIVMPCFFELDKYAGVWRSRALLHVYAKGMERGRFSFYSAERKKLLYVLGKKFYSYSRPKPNFRGRFVKGYVVDEEAYRQKKLDALGARQDPKEEEKPLTNTQKKLQNQRDILIFKLVHKWDESKELIAEWIGIDKRNVYAAYAKAHKTAFGAPPRDDVDGKEQYKYVLGGERDQQPKETSQAHD